MTRASPAGTKVSALPSRALPWVLDALPERIRAQLLAAGAERRHGVGEILYVAGSEADSLHLVLEGRVRLVREHNGRAVFLHDETAGGCLGEVPLFEGTTYPATAVASEPTRCLVLRRETILDMVRREPELALHLLTRLATRVRALVDVVDRNSSRSTLCRLAGHLLERAAAARGPSFTLGGTQQEVAEELGTVRELVVRGLRALRDRGAIVARGGGRYLVADVELLERVAAGEAP